MAQSPKQKIDQARRDAQVIELKIRGFTFRQIGNAGLEGVNDGAQAYRCFKRGMKSVTQIPADKYRKLENEKMDSVERRMFDIVRNTSEESSTQIKAATTLINLMRHRAMLNGLNLQPSGDLTTGVQTVLVDMSVLSKTNTEPDVVVGDDPH